MSPILVASIIGGYFAVLILISYLTSRHANEESFYTANRNSPWYLVAFGMIGASLSGVTFISVPGEVGASFWYYFQMVLGYLVGYLVIGTILLPLYYKMKLVSIYTYLESRFGFHSYKTGAFFFLLSRVVGAAFRLFLVAGVLQIAFFDAYGLPFSVSVAATILLIWIYTFRGGIKTIVYTDALQTAFMLLAVVVSIAFIKNEMELSWTQLVTNIVADQRSTIFNWEWTHSRFFLKQFFAGAFIAIVMTGLDQDMMQKNLTCRSLREAQKNMFWFSLSLIFVNLLFLSLGVLLYQYAGYQEIIMPERTDYLFPQLAINHFSALGGVVFLLGITAAAYSSADSALTSLTTSFCVDILEFKKENFEAKKRLKTIVHLSFSIILFLVILAFNAINDTSVINSIFTAAGYTYGPLLGLFAFGIFTPWSVKDRFVPLVGVLSPALAYLLNINSDWLLAGYKFGFEILIVNGLITFSGLWLLRTKAPVQ